MSNLIVLGCSLSAQQGWSQYLERQGHSVINLSRSAGSNDLQQYMIGECFLQGKVTRDSVVIWQITGLQRKSLVIEKFTEGICHGVPKQGHHDWVEVDVSLAQQRRVWLLSNNAKVPVYISDECTVLQNLAVDIYRWSLLVKKIIVVVGWQGIADTENLQCFIRWLEQKNITVVPLEDSIVNWCRRTGQDFSDDTHPAESGYVNWCKHNLERLISC